jgi:hypothetical protein
VLWAVPSILAGCRTGGGLPGAPQLSEVGRVAAPVPYLDATLERSSETLRFFFRDGDDCRALLAPGSVVEYAAVGPLGRAQRGDARCEPVGVASIGAWMSRRPRPQTSPRPRATARYRVIHRDEEIALARGDFPLATLAGFPGAADIVAVVPRSAACDGALGREAAAMEFSPVAPEPFWLIDQGVRCPLLGFADPMASAGGSEPEGAATP